MLQKTIDSYTINGTYKKHQSSKSKSDTLFTMDKNFFDIVPEINSQVVHFVINGDINDARRCH